MRLTSPRIGLLIPAFFALAACASEATDDGGEVADSDLVGPAGASPVPGAEPYYWAASSSYADFENLQVAPPFRTLPAVPDSDPISKRMQAWSDAIHARVSALTLRATGRPLAAPRPILKLVPAKVTNGWVSSIPVCLGPATIAGPAGRADEEVPVVVLRATGAERPIEAFGEPVSCAKRPAAWGPKSAASLDAYVAWFEGRHTKCKLRRQGSQLVVEGAGCTDASSPTRAANVAVPTTSPFIHITSALVVDAATEDGLVGVIAHELGHYYESHAITSGLDSDFDYWFSPTSPLSSGRPARSPESPTLETTAKRVQLDGIGRVPGQTLSRRMGQMLLFDVPALLGPGVCTGAAAKAAAIGVERSFFQSSFLTEPQQRAYLAYEKELLKCSKGAALGSGGVPTLAELTAVLPAHLAEAKVAGASTLESALRAIDAFAKPLDAAEDAFGTRVATEHLGRFTYEQSADDFAVRLSAEVGFTVQALTRGILIIDKARSDDDPGHFEFNNGLSFAKCELLANSGFVQNGKTAFVSLGSDLLAPHHSDCYRVFNQTARQAAERYVPAPKRAVPMLSAAEWTKLRKHAKAISATVPDKDDGPVPQRSLRGGAGGGIIID